ncbi:hypothetical protein Pfo_020495 [Paulownia fortunei]|nr:hypothetical protein Pfo_020495 [Paulownia fortunei]
MRSMNDPNLGKFLLKIENDEGPTNTKGNIKISKKKIINASFLALNKNDHSAHYITSRTILVAKNYFDETIDDTNNYYVDDFLNSLTQNGLSPHKYVLKRNCLIILLRYLDLSNGLCNGKKWYAFKNYLFQFRHKQFPIELCFAITIKKAQGQMIPNISVYLPHPVFSHG